MLPGPSNSQVNAKEAITELCDRIKVEYSNMYSHIQSLKSELEKSNSQKNEYERFCSLSHDMTYFFNAEIHKLIDVIKRLISACMQQIPYLPIDMQNSCFHLIEQVKVFTSPEHVLQLLPQPPPGMHGPPGQASHPPHHPGMNQAPHHLMSPHMHGNPHPPMYPPNHPLMSYMNRMSSLPPPPSSMHRMDSRENYPPGIPESYKFHPRDNPPPASDNCNGTHREKHNSTQAAEPNYNAGANSDPSIKQVSSEKVSDYSDSQNGNDKEEHTQPADGSNPSSNKTEKNDASHEVTNGRIENKGPSSPPKATSAITNKRPYESDPRETGNRSSPVPKMNRPPHYQPSKHGSVYYGPSQRPVLNGAYPPYTPPFSPYSENMNMYPMGHGPHSFMRPPTISSSIEPMMTSRGHPHVNSPYSQPPPPYPPSHMVSSNYSNHHQVGSSNPPRSMENGRSPSAGKTVYPAELRQLSTLQHGDVVCATSFSNPLNYVFTGSKGIVKIWDINDVMESKLLSSVDCLNDNYVRACKSFNSNKSLVVCGEHSSVGIWSLTRTSSQLSVNTVSELINPAPVCYNMALSPDERTIYCCCNDGSIVIWDIESGKMLKTFKAHVDGATSIDVTRDGTCFWTGGLDGAARCWDTREYKKINEFTFPTQVFSLCTSPCGNVVVVGLENKTIEISFKGESETTFSSRMVHKVHDSCVLTVKISNSGKWLLSSSKDNFTNCVTIPEGKPLFITNDKASILCTDISSDDKYVVTGSGDKKAIIYECIY